MEISIKDAAELLGKSERTVRHMAQTGRLPARRIGARWLINREDLLQRKASGATDGDEAELDDVVDAETDLGDDEPRSGAHADVTVSWHPSPRPEHVLPPGEITSVRELDSFHIATAVLARLGEVRRDAANAPLLRDAETHLREFLHLLADGCHADLHTRRDRFREAQSRVCAALTDLIHFNVVRAEPDLGPLTQRLEQDLIGELRHLLGETQRRLSWRGRAISLAESTLARVLTRLRGFAGDGRIADRLGGLQRTLTQALHSAR
ncbi:MAG: helix-turn-helix domain-containing protein [Myxococcales bacterium]|nr:helix-turn-helix domain-containing protein [Myxococcales bacterium]